MFICKVKVKNENKYYTHTPPANVLVCIYLCRNYPIPWAFQKFWNRFQREFSVHRCIIFTYLNAKQTFNMLNVTFPLAYSIEQLLGSLRATVLRCSLPLPHSSPQKTLCHCALCLAGSLFHCFRSVLHPVCICTSDFYCLPSPIFFLRFSVFWCYPLHCSAFSWYRCFL